MAFIETKIIQVANTPETINSCNEVWASFGWTVQNIQITHSQDTKTYTKTLSDIWSGDKTVETTTINYATITYQRDKHMPNYSKIAELENRYNELTKQVNDVADRKMYTLWTFFDEFSNIEWALGILTGGILLAVFFILHCVNMVKSWNNWKEESLQKAHTLPTLNRNLEAILEEAQALL